MTKTYQAFTLVLDSVDGLVGSVCDIPDRLQVVPSTSGQCEHGTENNKHLVVSTAAALALLAGLVGISAQLLGSEGLLLGQSDRSGDGRSVLKEVVSRSYLCTCQEEEG